MRNSTLHMYYVLLYSLNNHFARLSARAVPFDLYHIAIFHCITIKPVHTIFNVIYSFYSVLYQLLVGWAQPVQMKYHQYYNYLYWNKCLFFLHFKLNNRVIKSLNCNEMRSTIIAIAVFKQNLTWTLCKMCHWKEFHAGQILRNRKLLIFYILNTNAQLPMMKFMLLILSRSIHG